MGARRLTQIQWLVCLHFLLLGSFACAETVKVPKGVSSQYFPRKPGEGKPADFWKLPTQFAAVSTEKAMVSMGMDFVLSVSTNLGEPVKLVREPILGDYDALAKVPAFRDLESMLPGTPAYEKHSSDWHYFLYVPESFSPGDESVLVVFLHGFGGNFKVYPWWWKAACEKHGWIMLFPTFGLGSWDVAGADKLVGGSINHAQKATRAKPVGVFLVGLSNGAPGIAYVARKGVRHDGLVFVSGGAPIGTTLPEEDRTPALFVVGEDDWAFTGAVAARRVLESRKVPVTFKAYPKHGHFLLALERERVVADIADWIGLRLRQMRQSEEANR